MPIWSFIARHEADQGLHLTPATRNVRPNEAMFPQAAPDPIRQGATLARPARMPVAVMTDPTTFGLWGLDEFEPMWKNLTRRFAAGRLPQGVSVQAVAPRPNISRPPAQAYGSLFSLSPEIYGFG